MVIKEKQSDGYVSPSIVEISILSSAIYCGSWIVIGTLEDDYDNWNIISVE